MGKKDSTGKSKLSMDQYRKRLGNREKHECHGRHRPRELRQKEIQNFQPSKQFQNMWTLLIVLTILMGLGYIIYSFSLFDRVIPFLKSM